MDTFALGDAFRRPPQQVISSDTACYAFSVVGEEAAKYLARNLDVRGSLVDFLNEDNHDVFRTMGQYWQFLSDSFIPGSQGGHSSEEARIALALAIGKVQRNLIGGIWKFTEQCLDHEPIIRGLLFNLTTFTRIEDPAFHPLHAVLAQIINNIVSPQDGADGTLASDKWALYLSGRREEDVIIRLLDSVDIRTNVVTLTIMGNVMADSEERIRMVMDRAPGLRWLAKILNKMEVWLESAEEDSRFELSCRIFRMFIKLSLQSQLYASLGESSEAITPSQTTFLKILDSSNLNTEQSRTFLTLPPANPNRFLIPVFHQVSTYILDSMRSGGDDPRLAKIMEGSILVAQILSSVGLQVQEKLDQGVDKSRLGGDGDMVRDMKSREAGVGIIKPIVELLQQIILFFPRQKPHIRPPTPSEENTPLGLSAAQQIAVSGIKTDLVNLLGILTFEDKESCDWVRECGGVQIILGMTEVDETSPYLREHALFLVRNLMLKNPENQAIIKQMNPLGVIRDDTGELLPLPERMQRRMG